MDPLLILAIFVLGLLYGTFYAYHKLRIKRDELQFALTGSEPILTELGDLRGELIDHWNKGMQLLTPTAVDPWITRTQELDKEIETKLKEVSTSMASVYSKLGPVPEQRYKAALNDKHNHYLKLTYARERHLLNILFRLKSGQGISQP
jgi:hypothetical protein